MATATSTLINNDISSNYHTVVICADLPKNNKYYTEETIKDIPPMDYWINKIDNKADKERYKVQHIVANGACDTLSDAINYIYSHSNNSLLIEKLILNNVIEILFYDYIESSCHMSALHMIKNITVDQWKKQSFKTIQFVLKQISLKIQREDSDLLEDIHLSGFELKLRKTLEVDSIDDNIKENFNIIINVLTKIYMAFGDKQFIERSLYDPLYLFINEMWFKTFNYEQYRYNISYLLSGFTSIITEWLKFDYSTRQLFVKQIDHHISNNHQ
ncbi:unnamed protein product [Rotaria sp. Silwood2]|nr:unnamed protein product [Rotaria sp. Silwood2]